MYMYCTLYHPQCCRIVQYSTVQQLQSAGSLLLVDHLHLLQLMRTAYFALDEFDCRLHVALDERIAAFEFDVQIGEPLLRVGHYSMALLPAEQNTA